MKYVILKAEHSCGAMRVYPFVFPEYMTHFFVERGMILSVQSEVPNVSVELLSAGFCYRDRPGHLFHWFCDSGSESLGIVGNDVRSREDECILNMPEALQGFVS